MDISDSSIIRKFESFSIKLLRFFYKWLSEDDGVLAHILAVNHFMLGIALIVSVVISHTIYPLLWFKILLFIIISSIWLHHVVWNVCFLILAEKTLLPGVFPYYKLLEGITGINHEITFNYLIIGETVLVGILGLEITNYISLFLFDYFKV